MQPMLRGVGCELDVVAANTYLCCVHAMQGRATYGRPHHRPGGTGALTHTLPQGGGYVIIIHIILRVRRFRNRYCITLEVCLCSLLLCIHRTSGC